MASKKAIISDLKGLVAIINDGREGYQSASETTDDVQLKAVFLRYAEQRAAYAEELKSHIAEHGGSDDNDDGGILGALHRSWIDIKQSISNNEDVAILNAVETGEQAALEKYDRSIADYESHADHIDLLRNQRDGIITAMKEVERLRQEKK